VRLVASLRIITLIINIDCYLIWLHQFVVQFLKGTSSICMLAGIKNVKQVSLGVQHILADIIAKDSSTLSSIKAM